MIGFSAGRPHPLVLRAVKLARHRGRRRSRSPTRPSPRSRGIAEHRLHYSSNSPAFVRSHTALLALVQALAYGVYALDEPAYADRIKAFKLK